MLERCLDRCRCCCSPLRRGFPRTLPTRRQTCRRPATTPSLRERRAFGRSSPCRGPTSTGGSLHLRLCSRRTPEKRKPNRRRPSAKRRLDKTSRDRPDRKASGGALTGTAVDSRNRTMCRRGKVILVSGQKGLPMLAVLSATLLTSGCAKFSVDGGMDAVQAAAEGELGKAVIKITDAHAEAYVSTRVRTLAARPLTASSAVQIALLNNRGLQAAYNELGISEARMVEASLPAP